jgi:hypothetical protein
VFQCYIGDCKFTIIQGTECRMCGNDNTLEALDVAFKKLESTGLEDFNEFMLVHFPSKEIRDKHEIRLLSLGKEHLTSRLEKIQKIHTK